MQAALSQNHLLLWLQTLGSDWRFAAQHICRKRGRACANMTGPELSSNDKPSCCGAARRIGHSLHVKMSGMVNSHCADIMEL